MNYNDLFYLSRDKYLLNLEGSDSNSQDTWDLFFSGYNDSERVRVPFEKIHASNKFWLALPEYQYTRSELPANPLVLSSPHFNESDFIIDVFAQADISSYLDKRICIDITGLMRAHILFIVRYLSVLGIKSYNMIYTEPSHYKNKENTKFAKGNISEVRQISGFEGSHDPEMSHDVLIVGTGYDHELISRVILSKESARLVQLHSLPDLPLFYVPAFMLVPTLFSRVAFSFWTFSANSFGLM